MFIVKIVVNNVLVLIEEVKCFYFYECFCVVVFDICLDVGNGEYL